MRLGEAYEPRRALPVEVVPIFRAVFWFVRYPRSIPLSTSICRVVGMPSPSNGALLRPPARRASSTIVTRSLATRVPTLPAKRLRPLRTLSAEKSGEIAPSRLIAIHGSRITASFWVGNGCAPSFSTARCAARPPMRDGSRSEIWRAPSPW